MRLYIDKTHRNSEDENIKYKEILVNNTITVINYFINLHYLTIIHIVNFYNSFINKPVCQNLWCFLTIRALALQGLRVSVCLAQSSSLLFILMHSEKLHIVNLDLRLPFFWD